MAQCLIILAPGAEEIECITVADVLKRAGVAVTVASVADTPVVAGSRGIPLAAHTLFETVAERAFDAVYLPGGLRSAEHHRDDARTQQLIAAQLQTGRLLAAICAAPIALVPRRLCAGRQVTCYPAMRPQVEPAAKAWLDQPVVEDGNLITSQGPGTSMALALTLARRLAGESVAAQVARDMLLEPSLARFASGS
ncbi:MAG: DJ-1/PfpI family protein [Rhodocyclaceae bacterium]|nr:DJ-1/PfpI family protein [Rhodocyclaceae bacterium]